MEKPTSSLPTTDMEFPPPSDPGSSNRSSALEESAGPDLAWRSLKPLSKGIKAGSGPGQARGSDSAERPSAFRSRHMNQIRQRRDVPLEVRLRFSAPTVTKSGLLFQIRNTLQCGASNSCPHPLPTRPAYCNFRLLKLFRFGRGEYPFQRVSFPSQRY